MWRGHHRLRCKPKTHQQLLERAQAFFDFVEPPFPDGAGQVRKVGSGAEVLTLVTDDQAHHVVSSKRS